MFSLKSFNIARKIAAAFCVLFLSLGITSAGAAADGALDLARYKLTFNEDFNHFDVSAHGPATRWIAHTPWNGDFGAAAFSNPEPGFPFTVTALGLQIQARRDSAGKWHSGLICSRDNVGPTATGFAQEYGYFEMRAKLPDGPGVWPAFWLAGTSQSRGGAELDVMEYYGRDDGSFHSTEHFWMAGKDALHLGKKFAVPAGQLTQQFNDFGVLITPQQTTFYFNRRAYWATPTPPEYRQPFYILANLAIGGGWPFNRLTSPKVMDIEYIHVYALP